MTTSKKPTEAPATAAEPALEREKAELALRSQRLQNWLLIAAAVGSFAAFVFTNRAAIAGWFSSPAVTRIQVVSDDPFVRSTAIVRIAGAGGEHAQLALSERDAIEVRPGDQDLEVVVGDSVLLKTQVHAVEGTTRRVVIPEDAMRKIRVAVSDWPGTWHAQEAMLFKVTSSGTGYTWIFRSDDRTTCVLAFPFHADASEITPDEHFIEARQVQSFPRPGPHGTLSAPSQLGPAKLYVLVTSTNSVDLAKGIIANYCQLGVMKASGPDVNQNWGLQIVPFVVN